MLWCITSCHGDGGGGGGGSSKAISSDFLQGADICNRLKYDDCTIDEQWRQEVFNSIFERGGFLPGPPIF